MVIATYMQVLEATENAVAGDGVCNNVVNAGSYTFGQKLPISLDCQHHLVQCYRDNLLEYRDVCQEYEKYKAAERSRAQLFPSMANWTLTSALVVKCGDVLPQLLAGPPTISEKRLKATIPDKEKVMLIHLRCSQEEDNLGTLGTRSSYMKGEFVETEPAVDHHYIGDTPLVERNISISVAWSISLRKILQS